MLLSHHLPPAATHHPPTSTPEKLAAEVWMTLWSRFSEVWGLQQKGRNQITEVVPSVCK